MGCISEVSGRYGDFSGTRLTEVAELGRVSFTSGLTPEPRIRDGEVTRLAHRSVMITGAGRVDADIAGAVVDVGRPAAMQVECSRTEIDPRNIRAGWSRKRPTIGAF